MTDDPLDYTAEEIALLLDCADKERIRSLVQTTPQLREVWEDPSPLPHYGKIRSELRTLSKALIAFDKLICALPASVESIIFDGAAIGNLLSHESFLRAVSEICRRTALTAGRFTSPRSAPSRLVAAAGKLNEAARRLDTTASRQVFLIPLYGEFCTRPQTIEAFQRVRTEVDSIAEFLEGAAGGTPKDWLKYHLADCSAALILNFKPGASISHSPTSLLPRITMLLYEAVTGVQEANVENACRAVAARHRSAKRKSTAQDPTC